MARVANTNRRIAINLLSTIKKDIFAINFALEEQENNESKLNATYVSGRNAVAISAGEEIIKKIRWYLEVELSKTPVSPYDNAGIDSIDLNIRTFDDDT
jgi:7-cyano-7-deazaguanine synthase in queuosine biosynthesis